MWNWLKNLFGSKKQEGETPVDTAGQPMPPAPEEAGGEEDSSGEKN